MAHPYDRVSRRQLVFPVVRQTSDQSLRMHVYEVVARVTSILLGVYIGVVPIDQHVRFRIPERGWQEVGRPEDLVLGCPCLLRLAVQAVHKNYIDFGIGMRIHSGGLEARDLLVDRALENVDALVKLSWRGPAAAPPVIV